MMLKTRTLVALGVVLLAVASQADAQSTNVDLAGITVEGNPGTVIEIAKTDPSKRVTGIKWEFEYEANSPSWGSELRIDIDGVGGAGDGFSWSAGTEGESCNGDCDVDFGFPGSSGIFQSGGAFPIDAAVPEFWVITFSDTFNDTAVNPDGQFLSGKLTINKVPEPATFSLLGLSLLGLAACRRRV